MNDTHQAPGSLEPLEPPETWSDWVGRSELRRDRLTPGPCSALAATLDRERIDFLDADIVPALWHWLYFLPIHRQRDVGADGHPRRGGFLPPVELPRRMWAGGRLRFDSPLRVGSEIERRSTIESIQRKAGRGGSLVFVNVRHELRAEGAADPAVMEWQDIVYREAMSAGNGPRPAEAPSSSTEELPVPAFSRTLVPDETLLFRYSALTFNGHRIHYDRPYAVGQEGYPALVVHGPLIATLLLDLLIGAQPGAHIREFRFRAIRPAFDGRPLVLQGAPAEQDGAWELWASGSDGATVMRATATAA